MNDPAKKRGRPKKRSGKGRFYVQTTTQLDRDLITRLDAHLSAEGMESRSELIRKACNEYLRRAGKRAVREEGEDGRRATDSRV